MPVRETNKEKNDQVENSSEKPNQGWDTELETKETAFDKAAFWRTLTSLPPYRLYTSFKLNSF